MVQIALRDAAAQARTRASSVQKKRLPFGTAARQGRDFGQPPSEADGVPIGARGGTGDGRYEGRRAEGGRIDDGIRGRRRPQRRGSAHRNSREAIFVDQDDASPSRYGQDRQRQTIGDQGDITCETGKAAGAEACGIDNPRAKIGSESGRQEDDREDEADRRNAASTGEAATKRQAGDGQGAIGQDVRREDRQAADPGEGRGGQTDRTHRRQEDRT
jgi:hypothetical protein